MWNLAPPPGFQGLHPDKPITVYQRYLPHWRQDGATYFVTFRLADALPQSKLDELECLLVEREEGAAGSTALQSRGAPTALESRATQAHTNLEAQARAAHERIEHWLDQGMGS